MISMSGVDVRRHRVRALIIGGARPACRDTRPQGRFRTIQDKLGLDVVDNSRSTVHGVAFGARHRAILSAGHTTFMENT
jgi:hypothetical protein